jgi:hypothetical protein
MFSSQVKQINKDLAKKGRAIVSIGCSFVQGQGAINDEIFDNYTFKNNNLGEVLSLQTNDKEIKQILNLYPSLSVNHSNKIDFTMMEYENSFVYQLANHQYKEKYVPINLGQRGCGNRASIKELYFNNINWNFCKEIVLAEWNDLTLPKIKVLNILDGYACGQIIFQNQTVREKNFGTDTEIQCILINMLL